MTAAAQLSDLPPTKFKRELEYKTQASAASEPVLINQSSDLKNSLFEGQAGEEIFILSI
ncbi:hypothetical protein W97_04308 [Coniosporium apollinis CBS 100218]|uniref:Uncharacterized protein n=1 Tax=Coniosporium apollinis (strain CBS 100218) TaxID=1168221 RepID=R7YTB4_CONA1|nr:uncharacterized protein W97_04308 [Coniosporium apollinis CBS 100218]EON65073.1 hypothetical protein W97_04308 [Coniosporium apollinis CBS 100218]